MLGKKTWERGVGFHNEQRLLKTSRTDSLSPFHWLKGNLCHELIPARLSAHVAHMVPWLGCEPWAVHSVWDKELHLVTVLPARMSKLCSPSMDNKVGCKGAGVFPKRGNKWCYFYQKRHKDNNFSVCLIHMKACERHFVSLFSFCSAGSKSMSLHFTSWFPFWGMFKLFVKGKKKNAQFALLP